MNINKEPELRLKGFFRHNNWLKLSDIIHITFKHAHMQCALSDLNLLAWRETLASTKAAFCRIITEFEIVDSNCILFLPSLCLKMAVDQVITCQQI